MVILLCAALAGCMAISRGKGVKSIEEKLGIKIEGIRLSAGGYMLDFRYRVLEPDKAHSLFDPKIQPYLVDEATGAKFTVPAPPKVGSLRQKSRGGIPKKDRVYSILFANPARYVKAGKRVSIVFGKVSIEGVTVQ